MLVVDSEGVDSLVDDDAQPGVSPRAWMASWTTVHSRALVATSESTTILLSRHQRDVQPAADHAEHRSGHYTGSVNSTPHEPGQGSNHFVAATDGDGSRSRHQQHDQRHGVAVTGQSRRPDTRSPDHP